jgi:hypothetical protein
MSIEQLQQIVSGVRFVSLHYRQCRLERRHAAPAERSPPRPLSLDHSCLRSRSRLHRCACAACCRSHGHDVVYVVPDLRKYPAPPCSLSTLCILMPGLC